MNCKLQNANCKRQNVLFILPFAVCILYFAILFILLSPCLTTAHAADPSDPPAFLLETAGPAVTGRLEQLDADWSVRLGGRRTDGGDVIALRRANTPPPDYPADQQVLFANGDRLPAHVVALEGERLAARLPTALGVGGKVSLPLSALSVLWLTAPDAADDPALVRRRLLHGKRSADTVLLRNGDELEGTLTGLDDKAVVLEVNRKPVTTARSKVAAVALSTDLATPLRPRGPYARLVLADGTRLSLAKAACTDGAVLTGTTLFGTDVRIPLGQVVSLSLYQGRAVYLSDLKPRTVEETPYLGLRWPLVNDGCVDGRDLRLGGGTYDRGLGMHSAARVAYDLGGAYRRFEALVGIDDQAGDEQTGRQGGVRIRVLADGKPLGGDRDVSARTGPVAVRADLTGARELTLVVDFGDRGSVQDRVDWADARLVK
jgi:hypothetical protein